MEASRWRRMLGEVLPGVNLDSRQERVRMLRELLQREGWCVGEA